MNVDDDDLSFGSLNVAALDADAVAFDAHDINRKINDKIDHISATNNEATQRNTPCGRCSSAGAEAMGKLSKCGTKYAITIYKPQNGN